MYYLQSFTPEYVFLPIVENEKSPWWMVDMGANNCVGRVEVEVFNMVGKNGKYCSLGFAIKFQ